MEIETIDEVDFSTINWDDYHLIFLASGFEARSISVFQMLPADVRGRCVVLGFDGDRETLSRQENDKYFLDHGAELFVHSDPLRYEEFLRQKLYAAADGVEFGHLRVFIDYSVMTRVWYAYVMTWVKYSEDVASADLDFAYAHGTYEGEFSNMQIVAIDPVPDFEGVVAGSRQTIAVYGLGYDKFATLAVHEQIEPDRFYCFIAKDDSDGAGARRARRENSELISLSGRQPAALPISDLGASVTLLRELISEFSGDAEVMLVPMGPKPHVLATLLAGHQDPRLTCMHPRGSRKSPVQVTNNGRVSCWRVSYRI